MTEKQSVLVVTTPTVSGYEIVKIIGLVNGLTVRTRGIGGKIAAGVEGIFGGEVTAYLSEVEKARRESLARLVENALKMGANAEIGTSKPAIFCRALQPFFQPTVQQPRLSPLESDNWHEKQSPRYVADIDLWVELREM